RVSDNILITQELMHNYHRDRGPPKCAFKVDIQKAYDTVDWRFLGFILKRFGFHHTMIKWIMSCVTSASFSICINGNIYGFFKSKRGLRQGDPLSPYLFTLVMEILTLILKRRVRLSDTFRYHNHCEELESSMFQVWVPSIPKSTAFFCNVMPHVKNAILSIMPFSEAHHRIGDWKNKSLSFAGRLQLCKSVVSSMQVYWASVLVIPMGIVSDIQQLIRGFLWCNGDYKHGKAKVAWDDICLPKHEGGLGLRSLEVFNLALMTTHIWNIVSSKESLWVRWVHTYKLRGHTLGMAIRRLYGMTCGVINALLVNGAWRWPAPWLVKAPNLALIAAPNIDISRHDSMRWCDLNGNLSDFSVKYAWEVLRPRGQQVMWYHITWFSHCIPRHAFHIWLVMRRCLKTQDKLRPWDVDAQTDLTQLRCSLCGSQQDSHEHLFFECSYSSKVWNYIRNLAGMEQVPPVLDDIMLWFIPMANKRSFKNVVGKMLFAAASYYLWLERNNRRYLCGVLDTPAIPQAQRPALDVNVRLVLQCGQKHNLYSKSAGNSEETISDVDSLRRPLAHSGLALQFLSLFVLFFNSFPSAFIIMGISNRSSYNSKEDQTQRISKSVFITNFPDHFSACDLWNVCLAYGNIIDVFIPFKKSKAGKKFAFARFIRVDNLDRLIGNICTIWIGRLKLHANIVRFKMEPKNNMHASNNSQPKNNVSLGAVQQSFAAVLNNGTVKPNYVSDSIPVIVLDDSCIMKRDLSCSLMGKIKDINALPNLYNILDIEGFTSVKLSYLGGYWNLLDMESISSKEKISSHVGIGSWFEKLTPACNSFVCEERLVWVSIEGLPIKALTRNTFAKIVSRWGELVEINDSDNSLLSCIRVLKELEAWMPEFNTKEEEDSSLGEESDNNNKNDFEFDNGKNANSEDPFGIYKILKMKKDTSGAESKDPPYPPGFTPSGGVNVKGDKQDNNSQLDSNLPGKNDKSQIDRGVGNCGTKFQASGSILEVMDELIKELNNKHKVNFVALQETKMDSMDLFLIKALWGNSSSDYAFSPSIGYSGGTWVPSSTKLLIILIYAPQDLKDRKMLWEFLCHLIDSWDGECILLGDFNEVRFIHERHGSLFNSQGADAFNNFINMAGLIDIPLEGYSFTWAHKSTSKMNKLDRFLISEGLLTLFPSISTLCLDKHLSGHRPILLHELNVDYGPTPFWFFHSWSSKKGFDRMVENSWKKSDVQESNSIIRLMKKLKSLKSSIKLWLAEDKLKMNVNKRNFQNRLIILDKSLDQSKGTDDLIQERSYLLKELQAIIKVNSLDMAQKAKIRWAIAGDENSKYFNGIINKKRSQLAIRGVLVDGEWVVDPLKVKNEFLNHFANRFTTPVSSSITFDSQFPKRISSDQNDDLERIISYDEIKSAVWDCGTNKSPGPDGFTFEFYRKYWNLIDHDVVATVTSFFCTGLFPNGCNSSFIALIPNSQEAKMVKDFRPISLIGSMYKIITKTLANHLSYVIADLVSDVQSAFVSNRQILDGPFILNELLSWCKYKNSKALIFKIDFEKAFDSVRWDYLDVVLNNFGFGSKWRGWIQGCLNSALGSILVNGSPTTEFKFSKGFKQGDPLSPFFFILIMESLHLSFKNVVNTGLYKGIQIDESLTLSHLFYADDVIFVGTWNQSNLSTIVSVLKWFHCALGLKINLSKSKLMGVGIPHDVVASTTRSIGCSILHLPFNYLGVKFGGIMLRLNSWDDVVAKLSSRLSKWKLKTLSIGAIHGVNGAIDMSPPYSRRSPWLDIVSEVRNLSNMCIDLISLVKKKVDNGESTSFWNDLWLGDSSLNKMFPRLFSLETDKNISVAAKLRDTSLIESFRRLPRSGLEEEQLRLLITNTSDIMLPNISDRWCWQLDSSGDFSVKSAREFIDDVLLPRSATPTRWVKYIPIKINIFAWRVSLDKLPTRLNLSFHIFYFLYFWLAN
ncbi:RNA-directed DNA polymerase, eukaryota, partial [Tanacetum coccineum]